MRNLNIIDFEREFAIAKITRILRASDGVFCDALLYHLQRTLPDETKPKSRRRASQRH